MKARSPRGSRKPPQPKRDRLLLRACYDMFKKLRDAHRVESPFETTVFYDEADCDGYCLMNDIEIELELEEYS